MAAETDYRHVARCTTRHGRRGLVGLSWNEVRARAAAFAEEWKGAAHENGEKQSICNPGRLGSCSRCTQTRRLGSNERSDVNPQALVWAVGAVATGSLQALGLLIGNILKDYRIF